MEEWLPQSIPVLLIMDSEAERERYYNLRYMQNATNRFMFRSVMAGVSKFLGTRLSNAISKFQNYEINLYNPYNSSIIELCQHAKNWCFNSSGEQSSWKVTQWEPGQLRTAWAIRSHQLDSSFRISPKNRYGSLLVPNKQRLTTFATLSCASNGTPLELRKLRRYENGAPLMSNSVSPARTSSLHSTEYV